MDCRGLDKWLIITKFIHPFSPPSTCPTQANHSLPAFAHLQPSAQLHYIYYQLALLQISRDQQRPLAPVSLLPFLSTVPSPMFPWYLSETNVRIINIDQEQDYLALIQFGFYLCLACLCPVLKFLGFVSVSEVIICACSSSQAERGVNEGIICPFVFRVRCWLARRDSSVWPWALKMNIKWVCSRCN